MQGNGLLILFGSGETSPTGRAIHRKVFSSLPQQKQDIAILETPAGFQPNSHDVAKEVGQMFESSLSEFVKSISTIPARKRGAILGPDNEDVLKPMGSATFIFVGPGSPTYAVKNLRDTKALSLIEDRLVHGATISLSSAAVLASGEYTLPVYEIYKAGFDLYWEKGLNLLSNIGLSLTVLAHWNNREGGKSLDTSRCYMGLERFNALRTLLPTNHPVLGIGEHSAVIIDSSKGIFAVEGQGVATLLMGSHEVTFMKKRTYHLSSLATGVLRESREPMLVSRQKKTLSRQDSLSLSDLPQEVQALITQRETAREMRLFNEADLIRKQLLEEGYEVRDTDNGQVVYRL